MKCIIAGGREISDSSVLLAALRSCPFTQTIREVVSGKAAGMDQLGEIWAGSMNFSIISFPANWDKYGKSAGHARNVEMAEYANALIAIPGLGVGTQDMIRLARYQNSIRKFPIFIFYPSREGSQHFEYIR